MLVLKRAKEKRVSVKKKDFKSIGGKQKKKKKNRTGDRGVNVFTKKRVREKRKRKPRKEKPSSCQKTGSAGGRVLERSYEIKKKQRGPPRKLFRRDHNSKRRSHVHGSRSTRKRLSNLDLR